MAQMVKLPACNAGDPGSIPGWGRSPGEGNGSPLQYSCLENPMDRGAWWAVVHGVEKSWTQLSDFTFTFFTMDLEYSPFPIGQHCCLFHRWWWLLFSRPVMSDSVTPWTAACQASLSLTISQSLPRFMSIASVTPSRLLTLWSPLLLLPPIFPSIRDFFNESAVYIRWPKYWSFRFSISPSKEYSGSISLKIDLFDLLVVQGTLRNLLQHHSSKASILWHPAFFTVQLLNNHTWPLRRP